MEPQLLSLRSRQAEKRRREDPQLIKSFDTQIILTACLPELIPSLVAGTFFRRSRVGRYHHSYNLDGTVSARMQEKPRDLFERVFGTFSGSSDQENNNKRLKRSVLDSVLEQYRFFTGSNSPLGSDSKGRIKDHLDRVREFEQRAFSLANKNKKGPQAPPPSNVPHGGPADPGGEGIDITLEELQTEWRLLADLYALAIEMDRARFGSITFPGSRRTDPTHWGI